MIRRFLRWWARRSLDREHRLRKAVLADRQAQDWLELTHMTRGRPGAVIERLKDQYAASTRERRDQIERWYRREVAKIGAAS